MADIRRHERAGMDGIILRAGGSASRIIGDRSATDPGGGRRVLGGRQPAWQQPVGCVRGSHWTPNVQGFPALGSHSTTDDGRTSVMTMCRKVKQRADLYFGMGGGPVVSQGAQDIGRDPINQ